MTRSVALLGLSIGGLRAGVTPRWHAALGLVSATLLFGSATAAPLVVAGAGPLGLLGLVGWLLWVGWVAGYGIVLVRRVSARVSANEGLS
ncbi:hypothetical protein [Pseudonocardia aurantiaca]|uniref:Uncharacterized protein n=1 Tax=Pseudonocardia aurantiaca TaxID=75290 RepID=A0ABW4FFP6_9PSEU